MSQVTINETLDRDKIVDEAIYMAICARDLLKSGQRITPKIRLQLAIWGLQACLDKLDG